MGRARIKNTIEDPENPFIGQELEFERSPMLGRVIVDFDPGPELNIGIYSDDEFEATFDVIEE